MCNFARLSTFVSLVLGSKGGCALSSLPQTLSSPTRILQSCSTFPLLLSSFPFFPWNSPLKLWHFNLPTAYPLFVMKNIALIVFESSSSVSRGSNLKVSKQSRFQFSLFFLEIFIWWFSECTFTRSMNPHRSHHVGPEHSGEGSNYYSDSYHSYDLHEIPINYKLFLDIRMLSITFSSLHVLHQGWLYSSDQEWNLPMLNHDDGGMWGSCYIELVLFKLCLSEYLRYCFGKTLVLMCICQFLSPVHSCSAPWNGPRCSCWS